MTDFAQLPVGYRPYTTSPEIVARLNGTSIGRACTIYISGVMRLWELVPANTPVTFSGSFQLG